MSWKFSMNDFCEAQQQFAALTNPLMGSVTGSTGLVAPQAVFPSPVISSKRPLDLGRQLKTSVAKADITHPTLSKTNANVVAGTLAASKQHEDSSRLCQRCWWASSRSSENTPCASRGSSRQSACDTTQLAGPTGRSKKWGLPRALPSHSSLFFKVATRNMTDAYSKKPIELPGYQPAVFAMFLEWMYWGSYNAPNGVFASECGHDIEAWILGDKLEAAGFQNVAMNHLYLQYNAPDSLKPLTIETVTHVCARTATGSPLRLFLLDVLAQHFTGNERAKGALEDWDVALQKYPDARLLLLAGFRTYGSSGSSVKPKKNYLVKSKKVHSIRETGSAVQLDTTVSADSSA
ncbi:uncharacterized protein EKO05_0004964 [Ascochyta rabiei]|uniref:uncharacterized protein n=1 Tax=Didymella rabiei TaxID=5454 RepID=UPI002204ACBD|nr:uncharacterized protein EKO05_0004964 [Ascochyta rabiei]UPX14484.1 hypothetical protein EKO05_0004964 [Ascochyta rabiei]